MIKTLLLSFCLSLISRGSLFAQNRISLGPTYWYHYGHYTYQTDTFMASPATKSASYTVESSLGINVHYHFNQRWDIAVGLLYNTNTSHLTTTYFGPLRLITHFIQLPTLLNYRTSSHRLAPYFSAGAIFNINTISHSGPVNTSLVLGAGVDYRLSPKLSWLLQPTVNYLLYNPAETDLYRFMDEDLFSVGLQTQLIWHFRPLLPQDGLIICWYNQTFLAVLTIAPCDSKELLNKKTALFIRRL